MKIVLHNKYSDYLQTKEEISDIEVLENNNVLFTIKIEDEKYNFIFANLSENKLPSVILCNPDKIKINKPHFLYSKKRDLIILCLSIKEDISVRNKTYKEIIDYTILRIKRLLTLDDKEEKREFQKEFLYFWNKSTNNRTDIHIYANFSDKIKKLDKYENIKDKRICFLDNDISWNEYYSKKYKIKSSNVLYIPLINISELVPPLECKQWDVDTLTYIFNQCISEDNIEYLENLKILDGKISIVFEMNFPGILPINCVLDIKFKNKRIINIFNNLNSIESIELFSSKRCNFEYLFRRIGVKSVEDNKKVMVTGVGSLGSYIVSELPHLGVKEITLIDSEKLLIENIMRHQLGVDYYNYNKAFSMAFDLRCKYPEINVNYIEDNLTVNNIKEYDIDQYDLLIIATGGTDYMLQMNKYFHEIKYKKPVLYTWIEKDGIGVHALLVNANRVGCFSCLYCNSDVNKAHFNKKSTLSEMTGTGCGGVFNKYGNITLLKGTSMIIEVIYNIFENKKYDKNLLFSIRTSNLGGLTSDIRITDSFISKECEICGSKV